MSTEPHAQALLRPMRPRDPHEVPRAATPLELLYDLCFVVAIAQAAAGLVLAAPLLAWPALSIAALLALLTAAQVTLYCRTE